MNFGWSAILVVLAAGASVALLLAIRRLSPHGGHFEDAGRAAGVFGILATSFAVLFAFVVFLAFGSYDKSGSSAEVEAQAVTQQFETAQIMPGDVGPLLSAQLRCYARSVVFQEWPAMARGEAIGANPWNTELFLTVKAVNPVTPLDQAAYAKWLDQRSTREQARDERTLGEGGAVPEPLWIVLLISAAIVWGFVFLFADRGEGAVVQSVLIASVTVMLVTGLLLVNFLDYPYRTGVGSLKASAMEQSLLQMDRLTEALHLELPELCDSSGHAVARAAGR